MLIKKVYTLVFLRTESQILLGLKKRGFGVNKWNGFGGKLEPNETILEAAARELKEECCVTVKTSDLANVGHLEFTFEGESTLMDVRVFTATSFTGEPMETEEMAPKWFTYEEIPYDKMWPDDSFWLPYMLKGKPFFARFHYQGFDKILDYTIEEQVSMEDFYSKKSK